MAWINAIVGRGFGKLDSRIVGGSGRVGAAALLIVARGEIQKPYPLPPSH